jgi:hypothetical protein
MRPLQSCGRHQHKWDKKDIDSLVTPTTTFYIMKCRNAIVGCPGKDTFPNPKFHPEFIK